MCGIAAIIGNNLIPDESIKNMVASLRHRGPDADSCVTLPRCHLGHTRLSIIDLNTGDQPMSDGEDRYWIVFNGEIYNYRELRQDLKAQGYRFSTASDTEVILTAYRHWGESCLDHFRGMFAFVIWDAVEGRVFAARDLMGEKPLYYAIASNGQLFLSSELKGILASGLVSSQLDHSSVDAYLALGYVPPNHTIYSNLHVVPPAHFMTWNVGDVEPTCRPFWKPVLKPERMELNDASEKLHSLIDQAVHRQLVADVPVGAFLSGGLDSSTIVGIMRQHRSDEIKTFSVGFGNLINELPFARAVADRFKTDHYEVDLGCPSAGELLIKMASVYDEPFADSSHIPTFLISEFARRQVKVVLSGDGGDELFGGYWWYLPIAMAENVRGSRWQWMACRLLSRLIRERNKWLATYSVAVGQAARWPDSWERRRHVAMVFTPAERMKLWGECSNRPNTSFVEGDFFRPTPGSNGLDGCFYFDLTSYLPGDILVKVDRAAMAHGLETRAPFLDRDLVEFALSVPANLKVRGIQSKLILRHACERYWPEALRTRNKQGFGAPFEQWIRQADVERLKERIFAPTSRLSHLLPGLAHQVDSARSYQRWTLLTLGLWLEHNEVAV